MTAQGSITAGGGGGGRYGSLSFVYSCFFHLVQLPTSSSHSSISAASLSSCTPLWLVAARRLGDPFKHFLKKSGIPQPGAQACSHASWLQEAEMIANAANTVGTNATKRTKKNQHIRVFDFARSPRSESNLAG